MSFEKSFGQVKEANKCLFGKEALYEDAAKFGSFCRAFMSVQGSNNDIYIEFATTLTPPILQESDKFHILWIGNRHVVCHMDISQVVWGSHVL